MKVIHLNDVRGAYVLFVLQSLITFKKVKRIEKKKLELKEEMRLRKKYKNGV